MTPHLVSPTDRGETDEHETGRRETDEPRAIDGDCSICGGTMINVQGLLDCPTCGFRG